MVISARWCTSTRKTRARAALQFFFFLCHGLGGRGGFRAFLVAGSRSHILSPFFSRSPCALLTHTLHLSFVRSLSLEKSKGNRRIETKRRIRVYASLCIRVLWTYSFLLVLSTHFRSHSFSRSHSLTLTLRRLSLSFALFCFLITKHEKGRLVASRALTSIDFPRRANNFIDVRRRPTDTQGGKVNVERKRRRSFAW